MEVPDYEVYDYGIKTGFIKPEEPGELIFKPTGMKRPMVYSNHEIAISKAKWQLAHRLFAEKFYDTGFDLEDKDENLFKGL